MVATRSETNGTSKPDDSGYPPRTANQPPYSKSPASTGTTSPSKNGGGRGFSLGRTLGRNSSEQTASPPAAPAPTQQMTEKDSAASLVRDSTRSGARATSPPGGSQSSGGFVYDKSPATSQVTNATASSDPLTPIAAAAGRNPKRANTSILSSPPPYAVDDDHSPFDDTPKAGDAPGGVPPHNEDEVEYAGPNDYWSKSGRIDDSDQDYEDATQDSPSTPSSSFYGEHEEPGTTVKKVTRNNPAGYWDTVQRDTQSDMGHGAFKRVRRPVSYNGPQGGRAANDRQGSLPDMPSIPDDMLPDVPGSYSDHPYGREGRDHRHPLKKGGSDEEIYKSANAAQRFLSKQGADSPDLMDLDDKDEGGGLKPDQKAAAGKGTKGKKKDKDETEVIKFYEQTRPHYSFTNFSPHSVKFEGKVYPTSEHCFQARKFLPHRPLIAEHIRTGRSEPRFAFNEARKFSPEARSDWKEISIPVMEEVVELKFRQHDALRRELLYTRDAILIENSGANDDFWGNGADGAGRNELGKVLMKLRTKFREEKGPKKGWSLTY